MKILITEPTFAPGMDGPVFLAPNSFAEAESDTVRSLVAAGKALYIDGKDDPSRRGNTAGRHTATDEQLAAAQAAQKAEAAAAKAAPKA
jgi:hypothetical protein